MENVPKLNRKMRQNVRLVNIYEKPSPYKSNKNFQLTICKSKAIPLQTLTDPEGSRRLRLPDFKTIAT
jgi:hypothetical protein